MLSRFQLNAILRVRAAALAGPATNAQAGRIGINLSQSASFEYGHTYLDWMRRHSGPFATDAGITIPVTLKANHAPAASYYVKLQASVGPMDVGVYNCWMLGTCDSVSTTVGVITAFAYDTGNDKTTFTLTMAPVNGSAPVLHVVNPSTSSDYIRVIPAGYDAVANANDFHPDLLARLVAYGVSNLRGMDWLYTNGSADTNWATSVGAGGDGSIRGASASVAELVRLANRVGAGIHLNAPPSATADWLTNSLAVTSSNLAAGIVCTCEYSNEPWNFPLGNATRHINSALALGGSFSFGNSSIVSVVRVGGVVTVTLNAAPATSGPFYLQGVTNITGGFIDVATKGLAVSGNTFTYNEAGADVTGVAQASYNSFVHTNLAHYIVKALTTFGVPSANGVDTYTMLYRYIIEQTRAWWTIAQSLPDKARYRFILNGQVGTHEYALIPYAIERFGDANWIDMTMMAPYVQADSLAGVTSSDGVFALLAPKLAAVPKILVQQANAARSYRKPVGYYEGGQGTWDMHGSTTVANAVAAANRDDRMRVLLTTLLQYARDLGQSRPFNFYKDGTSLTFADTIDNKTWNSTEVSTMDLTGPKSLALIQWAAASSVPQPVDGLTWGTINITDVFAAIFGFGDQNGSRVVGTTAVMPEQVIMLVPPAAGTYPLSIFFGGQSASDWATILLNDAVLATQAPVVTAGGFSTPSAAMLAQTITVHEGINELRIQYKPAPRAGFLGLNRIVVG